MFGDVEQTPREYVEGNVRVNANVGIWAKRVMW